MADYCGSEDVLLLLQRFEGEDTSEKMSIMEELYYTPFGPIVKYFQRELDACEILLFEEALKKYVFPRRLKLAFPDYTYCRNCRGLNHISDLVNKVLHPPNVDPTDYYHFEHLAKSPRNTSTSVTCFGYFGVSKHRQRFDTEYFDSKPSVRWYTTREEIDDSYDGVRLEQYCYPFIFDQVMISDSGKLKYYPFDDEVTGCSIPDVER